MLIPQNIALVFAALVAGILGVASLYFAWRKRHPQRRGAVIFGWLLIAASIYFWIGYGGAEFGPVLAMAQLSLVAWLFVLNNRHVRSNKARIQQPGAVNLPRFQALARHAAIFIVAVPVAGLSGTFLVLALSMLFPWGSVDRMAFAILMIPVIWGLAVYWTCADSKLVRPAVGIVAFGSASAAIIFS